jgi:hypothetical protein
MATISPTKRTRSAGIGGCGAMKATALLGSISSWGLPGIGVCVSGFTPSATASAPVSTTSTPGVARAAAVSMDPTCAWPCGERTKHAYVWPGTLTSSL